MSDGFIGEIRAFGFYYVPRGWLACNGQTLAVRQSPTLYSLIGNTYGGTPNVDFKLPNLGGQVLMGAGSGPGLTPRTVGNTGGTEQVTLTQSQIPTHTHAAQAQLAPDTKNAAGNPVASKVPSPTLLVGAVLGTNLTVYTPNNPTLPAVTSLAPTAIGPAGGIQAHENRQPFLTLQYCICVEGTYPQFP